MHTSITTRRSARLQSKEATSFGRRSSFLRRGKRLYKKGSSQSLDVAIDAVKKLSQECFEVPSVPSVQKKVRKKTSQQPPEVPLSQKSGNSPTDVQLKTPVVNRAPKRSPPPAPRRSSRIVVEDIWNQNPEFDLSVGSVDEQDNVTPRSRSWRRSKFSDVSSVVDKRKVTVDAGCQTDNVLNEGKNNISQLTERIVQLEKINRRQSVELEEMRKLVKEMSKP